MRLGAIPMVFYWYNSYEWLRFKVEKNYFKSQLLKKISKKFKLKSEKLRIVKKTNSEENGIIAPNPNLEREDTNEFVMVIWSYFRGFRKLPLVKELVL